jgi:hypothetical protein
MTERDVVEFSRRCLMAWYSGEAKHLCSSSPLPNLIRTIRLGVQFPDMGVIVSDRNTYSPPYRRTISEAFSTYSR